MTHPLFLSSAVYLLKTTVLSGLLYSYYRLFLRNRHFHRFNRIFLLAIPLLSLGIPFIPLPFGGYIFSAAKNSLSPARGLQTDTADSWHETDAIAGPSSGWFTLPDWTTLTAIVYILTTLLLFYFLLRQLRYIRSLTKNYPREKLGTIHLFHTPDPNAPFSFLNLIFWNHQLDITSPLGQQIFRHELNHVRQKHSLDLLLLQPLTALCWINPFFHLVHREIKAVHEFLADNAAISDGDRYQYAEGLVWHTVRNPTPSLLHLFFQSPIKRRITMITQSKTTRTSLLGRAMILPLLFLLCCAFAAYRPPHSNTRTFNGAAPFTVVVDAGHGGIDPGATNKNGLEEKNINLAIAEKIKQLSEQYNVRVIMTRDADVLSGNKTSKEESLRYRADLANENKADLFLSIHTDMDASEYVKGFNIFVTQKNAHYPQCVQLGNTLTSVLKKTYTTDVALKQRQEGIYVLANTNMPAVLLLCGNINNEKDLSFISKDDNQEKVAKDILEGIRTYADSHPGNK